MGKNDPDLDPAPPCRSLACLRTLPGCESRPDPLDWLDDERVRGRGRGVVDMISAISGLAGRFFEDDGGGGGGGGDEGFLCGCCGRGGILAAGIVEPDVPDPATEGLVLRDRRFFLWLSLLDRVARMRMWRLWAWAWASGFGLEGGILGCGSAVVEVGSSVWPRGGGRRREGGSPLIFSLLDNKSSADSSSEIAYPRLEDRSGRRRAWPCAEDEPEP